MKKIVIIILIIAALAVGAYFLFLKNASNGELTFQYTSLEKGDLEVMVSCTGTLEVLGAVEVGTELSGTVSEVFVDFNDDVKKEQILAILDTTKIVYDVQNAKASFANAEAKYKLAKRQYEDDKNLYSEGYISDIDLLTSETNYKQTLASYVSSQISLEKAETNLSKYSIIRSPIDGKVIDRSVEEGQTVAASFSAPVLFTIAEDLSKMEIHALVDESDIGQIKQGQNAKFTVESYPDKEFDGLVKQIRLQPKVISNVVNYTVVIDADNGDDLLLPGMTATIDIITESRIDVYFLPNAAFSYVPPESVTKALKNKMEERFTGKSTSEGQSQRSGFGQMQKPSAEMIEKMAVVWFEDDEGNIQMTSVMKGFSDGINVELENIGRLTESSKIIISDSDGSAKREAQSSNRRMGGPPMRGLF